MANLVSLGQMQGFPQTLEPSKSLKIIISESLVMNIGLLAVVMKDIEESCCSNLKGFSRKISGKPRK